MFETDVTVIGSGCAGAAAAYEAAAAGASVVILEKSTVGGGPVKGANGPFAVDSAMQNAMQLDFDHSDAFRLHMDFTHWRVDARLVSDYINQSADTIAWLEGLGVKFSDVIAYYKGAIPTWHFKDPESPFITEAILNGARQLGAQLRCGTRATALRMDNGRVAGLTAQDADGTEIAINSGAVIIATGGFGGNAHWIKKYTGLELGHNLFSFAFPDVQGDGLRMAWEVGAAQSEMMMQTYVCLPEPYWGPGGTSFDLGTFRQPGLMVNMAGERFMNEEVMSNPAFAANAVRRQKNSCGFMILDENVNRYYQDHDWDFLMSKVPMTRSGDLAIALADAKLKGYAHLFDADTLDELAREMGVDVERFIATVDEYNEFCLRGRDPIFNKSEKFLKPVRAARFYAARFYLGGYGSLGGIKINYRAEVLNMEDDAIPGLYGAGRDVNAIYAGTYPYVMSGNDSAFDFNIGRIAGRSAARYTRS